MLVPGHCIQGIFSIMRLNFDWDTEIYNHIESFYFMWFLLLGITKGSDMLKYTRLKYEDCMLFQEPLEKESYSSVYRLSSKAQQFREGII